MATLIVKSDGSGQFTSIQSAVDAASNGDIISVGNGTYSSAGLSVNKQVTIIGESQSGVLIQDTRTNSQSFLSVSVDNVTLQNLTVRHVTSDTNIGHAIVASGGGFPQVRLNNFKMINVKSQYCKGGLSVRSDNFQVEGCTFEVVGGSSTRRGILHYGNGGNSIIKNCHFINNTTGALRAICPTSTSGSNPSDNQSGILTIEGSTFTGNLSQFVNIDNHQGLAGAFELIVKNNVTPETNAFVVSYGVSANFGNVFSKISFIGNTLTNNHASGLGKGMFAVDGLNLVNYRTSPLPIVAFGNTLGQLSFRSGYLEATGSTGSLVGFNNVGIASVIVTITGAPSVLVEPSQALAGSPILVSFDKQTLKQISKVSSSATFSVESNWKLVSFIYKKVGSSQRLVSAFRDFEDEKTMNLKSGMNSGNEFELHKVIISTPNRTLMVLKREEIDNAESFDFVLK